MNRLESIQHLRGIAALLVVFIHFPTPLARFCGSIGVDIFFLISGFIIYTSIFHGNYAERPLVFLKKRLLRIVPLYYAVILIFVGVHFVLNSLRYSAYAPDLQWSHILSSLLFTSFEIEGVYRDPIVFLGWSLNFEMYFYLLSTLTLIVFGKRFFHPLVIILIVLGSSSFFTGGSSNVYIDFFTSPFLLYFAVGMLVGRFREELVTLLTKWAEPLFFIALYTLFVVMFAKDTGYNFEGIPRETVVYNSKELPRVIIWGLPSLLFFISYFLIAEKYRISNRYLKSLGDRSYSIYLLQIFFIYLLLEFYSFFGRHERTVFSLFLIVILVWISGFTYRYFEKRFYA